MRVNKIFNKNTVNVGVIIEARMSSSRLPGKVLKKILNKPMLTHMLDRIKHCRTIDNIVIACTNNAADNDIEELAIQEGVNCFRGSEYDVLKRVLEAAQKFDIHIIVETPGDFPLIDPGMIDKAVSEYMIGGVDYVVNVMPYCLLPGSDIRVFSVDDLLKISKITSDPADREHVSIYFHNNPSIFRVRAVNTELDIVNKDLRLAVDNKEDFELVTYIFKTLYSKKPYFTMYDVFKLLNKNNSLRK